MLRSTSEKNLGKYKKEGNTIYQAKVVFNGDIQYVGWREVSNFHEYNQVNRLLENEPEFELEDF